MKTAQLQQHYSDTPAHSKANQSKTEQSKPKQSEPLKREYKKNLRELKEL